VQFVDLLVIDLRNIGMQQRRRAVGFCAGMCGNSQIDLKRSAAISRHGVSGCSQLVARSFKTGPSSDREQTQSRDRDDLALLLQTICCWRRRV
jgi:hypothetical protein